MIIMFIAALMGFFMVNMFSLNYVIQGLNRAVIYTPIELLFNDVTISDTAPKFSVEDMRHHLDDYYREQLSKYVDKYSVDYYFYNQSDDSICLSPYCDALEIEVNCTITMGYQYHRVMYYELVRG